MSLLKSPFQFLQLCRSERSSNSSLLPFFRQNPVMARIHFVGKSTWNQTQAVICSGKYTSSCEDEIHLSTRINIFLPSIFFLSYIRGFSLSLLNLSSSCYFSSGKAFSNSNISQQIIKHQSSPHTSCSNVSENICTRIWKGESTRSIWKWRKMFSFVYRMFKTCWHKFKSKKLACKQLEKTQMCVSIFNTPSSEKKRNWCRCHANFYGYFTIATCREGFMGVR